MIPLIGLGLILVYELYAAITNKVHTVSEMLWHLSEKYKEFKYIFAVSMLLFTLHILGYIWAPDWAR